MQRLPASLPPTWILIGLSSVAGLVGVSTLVASRPLGNLIALLGALGGLAILAAWFTASCIPLIEPAAQRVLEWLRPQSNRPARVLRALLEPHMPDIALIVLFGAILTVGTWLFLAILEDVATGDTLVAIDRSAHDGLQRLRSYWGDYVLVGVTELGDGIVVTSVSVVALAIFLVLRQARAALYFVIAVVGAAGFVAGVKWLLHRPRPLALYEGNGAFAFPSGHATMSVVVYGFLTIMIAHQVSVDRRRPIIGIALLLILLIAFSRIYLGAHWLSDVVAGLSFGAAWIALLSILFFRRLSLRLPGSSLAVLLALALVLVGGWHIAMNHAGDMQRYRVGLETTS